MLGRILVIDGQFYSRAVKARRSFSQAAVMEMPSCFTRNVMRNSSRERRSGAMLISSFILIFIFMIPVLILFVDLVDLFSFSGSSSGARNIWKIWPVASQYNSVVNAGHGDEITASDIITADVISAISISLAVISVLFGVTHLDQRDRLKKIVNDTGMSHSKFALITISFGLCGVIMVTMPGSYETSSEILPQKLFSPKAFMLFANLMFTTGTWFFTEGFLFLVWWLLRGRIDVRV